VSDGFISSKPQPGDLIGDKYVVLGVLGTGASATVYEAGHREIGTTVAVKVVHAETSNEPYYLARFRREARTCGMVRSAHVPQIYDVGRLPDGSPYIVMERLHGETLEAHIARGPMPISLVFEIGKQLLRALEAVHAARAIHRDVKPENLVVEYGGNGFTVKLVDFGISKSLDEPKSMTMDGMVLGTPHYMAPEQVEGADLDERIDVYAAGAVLYEMITGRTPFQGTTADQVMVAVQSDPVMPPGIYRDECPFELEAVVMTAMSRDRELRFVTARMMREALEEAEHAAVRESPPTPLVVRKDSLPALLPRPPSAARADADSTQRIRRLLDASAARAALDDDTELALRRSGGARRWLAAVATVALVLGGMVAAAFVTGESEHPSYASRRPVASPVSRGTEARPGAAAAIAPVLVDVPAAAQADAVPETEPAIDTQTQAEGTEVGAQSDSASAAGAGGSRDARQRARRVGRRGPPVTTVLPARGDPADVRAQIREEMREALMREWPGDDEDTDAAKESERLPRFVRDNPFDDVPAPLPPVVRDNPFDDGTGGQDPPPNPF